MELVSFGTALRDLSAEGIRSIASDLTLAYATPADEIAATRAMLTIEHALRRQGRQANAALASLSVATAVQAAARRAGVELPDDDVTRVARAAAQLARALVAGDLVATEAVCLARGWERLPGFSPATLPV